MYRFSIFFIKFEPIEPIFYSPTHKSRVLKGKRLIFQSLVYTSISSVMPSKKTFWFSLKILPNTSEI